MKRLLSILLLSFSFLAHAQKPPSTQTIGAPNINVEVKGGIFVDSVFWPALRADTNFTPQAEGAIIFWISNRNFWGFRNGRWQLFGAGNFEPIITPSNLPKQYWDGYKQFVTFNTDSIVEGVTNLFFTNGRARAAISLTTTGTSGVATYSSATGVLNVPNYGSGAGGGTLDSVGITMPGTYVVTNSPLTGTGGTIHIAYATELANTFLAGPSLGSPAVPTFRTIAVADLPTGIPNGNLANGNIGFSIGTAGVAPNWQSTPVALGATAVLNLPIASATATGVLSLGDWATFNNKVTSVNGLFGVVVTKNADSIKHLPVDTTSNRNGYVLTFDSTNHKWYLAPGGGGGGTTYTIGTIDGNGASVNGLSISGSSIFAQSASVTNPGLVNTGVQSFSGNKTFIGGLALTGLTTKTVTATDSLLLRDAAGKVWSTSAQAITGSFYDSISQVDSVTFTLNRPNGSKDTVRIRFNIGAFITTASNALTLTGTNVQWGGTLVQNTTVTGAGFATMFNGGRLESGMGASVASANSMTLGNDGNLFTITGNTQINALTTTNWQAGSQIAFIFTGVPLLKNNTAGAGGTAKLLLAGSVDYQAAIGDYISFQYDGSFWHETNRKLVSAGGAYTFSNGLTEFPATQVKLGGTLSANTTIALNNFYLALPGGRFEIGSGAAIAAANDLTLGPDGNLFQVTGNTQINAILTTNWQSGSEVSFIFSGTPLLKNNTAGGINTAPMLLAGRVDYSAAAGDYIAFQFNGTSWYETNRKLAGSVSGVTASNGLTATAGNVTLGGTLTGNTTIAAGTFTLSLSESGSNPALNAFNTSTGLGAQIQATSGEGAVISSITGTAVDLDISPASTTTAVKVVNVLRSTSGTAAAGMGGYIGYQLKDAGNFIEDAGAIQYDWADAAHATFTSELRLKGVTGGGVLTDWMIIKANGVWNAPQIASWGNFVNNAAAISGGLVAGDLYRNGDVVQIVH